MLAQQLLQLDFLDEQIADREQHITRLITDAPATDGPPGGGIAAQPDAPAAADGGADGAGEHGLAWAGAVALLDTIPGVGRMAAEQIVAEIGTDMGQFARAAQLASWAKLCPGNDERAGKRRSGRTGQGNRWVRSVLIQAAGAAVKVKDSALAGVYHRLAGRRGVKRAILAVAHRILVAAYYMLRDQAPYREPGAPPADKQRTARLLGRMLKRIEQLGYTVSLEPVDAVAA